MNDRPRDDESLRDLLHDTVSDVEPRPALDAIRNRTKVTPMSARRPWIIGAGAAVVATAATIAAVSMVGNTGPSRNVDDAGPAAGGTGSASASASASPSAPTSSTSSAATGADTAIPVYYVGDTSHGPRLYREFHQVTTANPLDAALTAAVGSDPGAPGMAPEDPDYRSPWPSGTTASGSMDGGTITVDLTGGSLRDRPAGMSKQEAEVAVQQLVYTAQAVEQKTAPVQLLLDGQHSDTVLGVPTAEPLARGNEMDVLAQVWITSPDQGAVVQSGFKVEGLAAAFEANVQWELKQGDKVVKSGFTTARECCKMAPYSFTVKAPAGEYTLVVHDADASGGEGPGPYQDTKDVTVTP